MLLAWLGFEYCSELHLQARLFFMLTSRTGLLTLLSINGALRSKNRNPRWQQELMPPFLDGQLEQCIAPTGLNTSEQFKGLDSGLSKIKTVGSFEFCRSASEALEGKQTVL